MAGSRPRYAENRPLGLSDRERGGRGGHGSWGAELAEVSARCAANSSTVCPGSYVATLFSLNTTLRSVLTPFAPLMRDEEMFLVGDSTGVWTTIGRGGDPWG